MSRRELHRKSVLEMVEKGHLTLMSASSRLKLSYRQTLRVYGRFLSEGDEGLIHRRRGCGSNRAYSSGFREQVLHVYRAKYQEHGFGPTLAAEKMAASGLIVDHETLRRWLLASGDWQKRRRRPKHRTRRDRRLHFGELVQMDGSHHDWFGPGHGKSCLMNMVDDATGTTMGLMDFQETTEAAMNALRFWIERYGVPQALYTDAKNVYVTDREPTLAEQLAGEEPLTAFGKACDKLGIEIITACSPQAKGRVERSNGIYQDRFVKELALRGVTTLFEANQMLANGFTDDLNGRFSVAPAQEEDYHRALPKGLDLDTVFCHEACRTLNNDWTIRHKNRYYQILKSNRPLPKPKDRILVRTHLDGRLVLLYRDREVAFTLVSPEQLHEQRAAPVKRQPPPKVAKHTPSQTPWKKWRPNCDRLKILQEDLK